MVSLNLRNANGSTFDPSSYSAFNSWLQGSSSTNMAYNLSAQLAAMRLNVLNGKVGGSSLISAPGTVAANPAGFATVNDLMNEANTELGLHGLTTSGSPFRAYQTALRARPDERERQQDVRSAGALLFQLRVDARSRLSRPTPISSG